MHIQEIRNQAIFEEIDYVFLKEALKGYAQPRLKINAFLKAKDLIRIKKGLYVFGPKVARDPYCRERLANLIYGPSAISLEYALSYYGLIPEKVEEVTSITPRRNKHFNTPLGAFTYHYLHPKKYPIGISQLEFPGNRNVLFATKEKALCDFLILKSPSFTNTEELEHHLLEDLRIEEEYLFSLEKNQLIAIAKGYTHKNINMLINYLYGESHELSH